MEEQEAGFYFPIYSEMDFCLGEMFSKRIFVLRIFSSLKLYARVIDDNVKR